jgi:hypothetical protein
MSKAQLVITAVVLEGRGETACALDEGEANRGLTGG